MPDKTSSDKTSWSMIKGHLKEFTLTQYQQLLKDIYVLKQSPIHQDRK